MTQAVRGTEREKEIFIPHHRQRPIINRMDWQSISGLLCDICGVLFDPDGTGRDRAIDGSVEAVKRLKAANFPLKFVTNESHVTRAGLTTRLLALGFPVVEADIVSPVMAVKSLLVQRQWKAHLLVSEEAMPDLLEVAVADASQPADCVVIGDAAHGFSYSALNAAFQRLAESPHQPPRLISLGKGRFYRQAGQLHLDVGAFTTALEFACGIKAEVVGKPDSGFFRAGIAELPDAAAGGRIAMVGDDIVSDIGGAMAAGLLGIQVRTGKFRPAFDEPHPTVTPSAYVDNLKQLVDHLLN